MDTASKHLIIRLPVRTHSMVSHSMGPSSGQAVEGFHGVEVVAESMVAAEGSVVGSGNKSSCMGASDGILLPYAFIPRSRPGVSSGLILSSAFYPVLKAGVWRRRSIKTLEMACILFDVNPNRLMQEFGKIQN
jgi:hypothetical protein